MQLDQQLSIFTAKLIFILIGLIIYFHFRKISFVPKNGSISRKIIWTDQKILVRRMAKFRFGVKAPAYNTLDNNRPKPARFQALEEKKEISRALCLTNSQLTRKHDIVVL